MITTLDDWSTAHYYIGYWRIYVKDREHTD